MELRALTAAAILALGPGCTAGKLWKKDEVARVPDGVPTAPLAPNLKPTGNGVVQASATVPAATSTMTSRSSPIAKLTGKDAKKVPVADMMVMWRNKVDFLPDPSRNGEMGPGIVGQMFTLGPKDQFAPAEGKLIVALYDETPRPPGVPPNKPEGWEFTKETLKGLITPDERFGLCYALFLPWPTYRPDVTQVRIAVRFEPEGGPPLYGPETNISLDTRTVSGGPAGWTNRQFVPGAQPPAAGGFTALGGPPPSSGGGMGVMVTGSPVPSAGPTMPAVNLQPAPANYGAPPTFGPGPVGTPVDPATLPSAFPIPRR